MTNWQRFWAEFGRRMAVGCFGACVVCLLCWLSPTAAAMYTPRGSFGFEEVPFLFGVSTLVSIFFGIQGGLRATDGFDEAFDLLEAKLQTPHRGVVPN